MNNVVSINQRKSNRRSLGTINNYAQNSDKYIPDDLLFLTGVTLTIALPEGIYSAEGGLVPFIVFSGCALTGFVWGLIKYYRAPEQIISCVSTRTMPQAPPNEDNTLKAA